MRILALLVSCLGVAAVALAPPQHEPTPMLCDARDAGPIDHLRTSPCETGDAICIGYTVPKDACPSVEQWQCYPAGHRDVNVLTMNYCRMGWRESLDGGG